MAYYFSAQIRVTNPAIYSQYLAEVDEVFSRFGGEYLAVDNAPVVLEGAWSYTRSVLIRFDTKSQFDAWYYSADYQRILQYRLSGATCDTILIKGKESEQVTR